MAVDIRCVAIGSSIAVASLGLDQIHKWWMLHVFDIEAKKLVVVTPFLDLVMVWNRGISYGLFPQDSGAGRLAIIAMALAIVTVMIVWLFRTTDRLVATAIGFVVGGALGNAVDRHLYGAVADFFASTPWVTNGTCLTLPMSRLLPEWRYSCMTPSRASKACRRVRGIASGGPDFAGLMLESPHGTESPGGIASPASSPTLPCGLGS